MPSPSRSGSTDRYLSSDVLQRIDRLELRARRLVEGFLTGRQASPYQGSAVEFASHREYSPGDDPRHLDWKLYYRTRRLYVKQHQEETHLPCLLMVDASRSMNYGAESGWSKYDHAATLAASLAYLLHHQHDAVGLSLLAPQAPATLPPTTHAAENAQLFRLLEQTSPNGSSDPEQWLRTAAGAARRRGLVVIISDLFVGGEALTSALDQLRARKQETLVLQVLHGDELDFPFDGTTLFRGLEGPEELETDPRALRRSYLAEMERFLGDCRQRAARAGAEFERIDMREPLDAALARYLAFRRRHRPRR